MSIEQTYLNHNLEKLMEISREMYKNGEISEEELNNKYYDLFIKPNR